MHFFVELHCSRPMPGPHFHTTDAQQLEVADLQQCNTVYNDCALGVEVFDWG